MKSGHASRVYSPTMLANGHGKRGKHNPLRGHYSSACRNPDNDDLGELSAESGGTTTTVKVSSGKRGRPAGVKNKTTKAAKPAKVVGKKRGRPTKAKVEGEVSASKPRKTNAQKISHKLAELKKFISSLESKEPKKGKPGRPAAAKAVRMPSIKIEVVTHAKKKSTKAKTGEAKTSTGKKRGRPAGVKNKPKTELVANGSRGRGMRRNPEEVAAALAKKTKESRNLGPYKFTLLRNPIMDASVFGHKVIPAVAGTVGTVALSQLIRNLPWVSDMAPGILKAAIPSVVTVLLAGFVGAYAKKNGHVVSAQICDDVVGFGFAFGINDVVGAQINELVGRVKTGGSSTSTTVPASTAPATTPAVANGMRGLGSGRFVAPQLNGGGWGEAPEQALNGYLARSRGPASGSQGYPPVHMNGTGTSGYPPVQQQALNGYYSGANSAATVAAMALNGGQFRGAASLPAGLDLGRYKD